jgi:CBS domain-containing membrane protein
MRLHKKIAFYFGGDQPSVSWYEKLRSSFGAFLGLALVIGIAKGLGEFAGTKEWFMASLGASALLVFVLPGSPMAQPLAVIGGNLISAFTGIISVNLIGGVFIALPLAVGLSILAMFILRCLHPPAAAVALIVVLGGISRVDYALFPVLIDSVLLVLAGGLYSNLTGKRYPNRP